MAKRNKSERGQYRSTRSSPTGLLARLAAQGGGSRGASPTSARGAEQRDEQYRPSGGGGSSGQFSLMDPRRLRLMRLSAMRNGGDFRPGLFASRRAENNGGRASDYVLQRDRLFGDAGGGGGPTKTMTGITVEDLLSQLGGGGGMDPYAASAAAAVANSAGTAPSIDIASALAPYDQAKVGLQSQFDSSAAELSRIAAGRDQDRRLADQSTQARLQALAAQQAAAQRQGVASQKANADAATRDLAAQGIDAGYAAASSGAAAAGQDQLAQAAAAQLQAEQASAQRSMDSMQAGDAEAAWTSQANLTQNRDVALVQLALARADAEAQLRQAEQQLQADFAGRQADAQMQAAGILADGQQQGMDLQGAAMDQLSQLGGDAFLYPQRDAVRQQLVAYDGGKGKIADDLFNRAIGASSTMDEFQANLELILSEQDAMEREAGRATPRQWDRDWFNQLGQQWFQQGGIDPTVAQQLLMRLNLASGRGLGGGGATSAAALPFGGLGLAGRV